MRSVAFWALISFALLPSVALSTDYRAAEKRAIPSKPYVEDRTTRLAVSLGRATGAIPASRVDEVVKSVNSRTPIPADLANRWQKLLRIAQTQSYIEDNPRFYSVGYEFETGHVAHYSSKEFEKGARAYQDLISESFGVQNTTFTPDRTVVRDEAGREWQIVREWIREWVEKDGWEVVTPPVRQPEHLQAMAAFRWRLGESPWGRSTKMTGLHQTYELAPIGKLAADSKLMARTAANMLLLQAQFGPAIFDLLEVKRFGGHENIFLRPLAFDHGALLENLRTADPKKLDLKILHKMMFTDALDTEFQAQLKNNIDMIEPAELKAMQNWTPEQKRNYRFLYKYRDAQIKFNLEDPRKTLLEIRIGDYVSNKPEQTMLQTMLYQDMIDQAHSLAEEGKLWDLQIPKRLAGETDTHYWNRMRLLPEASRESLVQALGITDPNKASLLLGRGFQVTNPGFKAGAKMSFAFEIEGRSDRLVDLILPRDPEIRKTWRNMSRPQRVEFMAKLGFEFDDSYSEKKHRILTSEFYADTERAPQLNPELHLEASGNWEIKTNSRAIADPQQLKTKLKEVAGILGIPKETNGGIHMHMFIPDTVLGTMTPREASEFTDLLERLSFYMTAKGYAEVGVRNPPHYMDSWSLDRFSPKDLEQIEQHLLDKGSVTGYQQKYHNIAFRPVKGGLDLEVRDLDDQIDFGLRLIRRLKAAAVDREAGGIGFKQDPPLFMELRDHADLKSVARYTIQDAVAQKYPLTADERKLLHKIQFEIYKPSMGEYFYFDDFSALNETPPHEMNTKMVRTNFEDNLAIPLLNYEEQSFLAAADKQTLAKQKEVFVDRVHAMLKKIQQDPKYRFLSEHDDFLYLADYLERSTHPSKPNLNLVSKEVAAEQRKVLEQLTYEMRSLVVRFTKETQIDGMFEKSLFMSKLRSPAPKKGCVLPGLIHP